MLFLPLLLWTALFCHTSDAQVSSQNRNKGRGGSRDGSRVGSRSSVPGHPTSFRNEPVLDLTPKFFILAPAILRLGTKQNILLEAHSLSQPVTAILSIEFPGHPIGPWIGSIMLNSGNDYSALITVENMFRPHDMRKKYAYLTVTFGNFHRVEQMIKFSYQSGYIFIQTDKPIYNPGDTVRYRAFVSNPEFQAFESTISLEIQNPDEIVIHALARANANDGILSNAYTLPAMAKEGRWKVVAKFDNVKGNTFSMPFEVKKYVLPAFNVTLTPKKSHFSLDEEKLEVEVTARYLYGERVQGVAYVLFGVEKEGEKRRVSSMKQLNDLDGGTVSLTMEEIKQTYPNTHSLVGASLYVKASVMTSTGSDLVEAEKSGIKIVLSPYVLSFRDTPQYFKPGLPFDMTVTVSHHDGSPAPNIPFRINFFQNPITEHSGTIKVSLNMPATISSQIIIVETLLPGVKAEQQAVQELRVEPYLPFNTFSQNYLYISVSENRVEVGQSLNIKVHISMSSREHRKHVKQLSYAVLNKGNIIKADRIDMGSQDVLNIPLLVTTDMLPAFRLVAYFMLPWQFNAEVVADSVLVDVEDQCVGSLSVGPVDGNEDLSISSPGNSFKFHVKGDSGAKVSLVAVDNAIFLLNKNRLTQKKLWEMVGKSDMGCTTGGGKNSMAVFSNAGLMFYSSTGGSTDSRTDNCPKRSRRRRSAARRWLSEQLEKEYSDKSLQRCCADGMREIPMPYSCYRRSLYITEDWSCVLAFRHCCAQYRGEKLDPVTSPPTTTLPPTTTGPPTTISVFSEIHPTHEVLLQLPGPQGRPDSIGMPGIEFLPGLAIRPGWPGQSGRPGWALETGERGLSRLQEEPDLVFEEIDEVEVEEIDEDEYADMDGLYVRSKFFESWLWVDIRLPNEPKFGSTDGLAVFPVETVLPDSITQWGFLAISASPETGFCVAEPYNVKAWKPFFIDLRLPHSVSRNEHVEIKAVIYNYKKEDLEVMVILDKTEDMCSVAFNKPHRQHVSVRASSSVLLKYTIIPLKTGDLPLQLTALTRFSDNDVVQKTLRVVVEGIQRTEARSFVLNPSEKGDQAGRQLITVKKAELDSVVPNSKPETFINVIDGLITDSIDNSINKDALAALIRMPGGCVEQNLASMTFPIIAAHYLDRSEQWDSIGISRKEEAIKYIQKGYENQLNYRKPDDSYPPYLREGTSTWITAYVVKVFSMARPFISVSKERLCGPLLYLLEHKQEPDGSFKEDNPVYTTRMTGGLRGPESRATLTAFVLIAMQENIIPCNKPGLHIWERYTQAATYLRERFFKLKRPYSAAIACYALELSSQGCMKSMLLKLASPDRTHWPDSDNRFFTLEATGYALLALIKGGHMEEAAAPFRWLNEQRGIGGGYGSTQSTMVVLQALSEYLVRRPPPSDINLLVELSVPGRKNMHMSFLPKLVPKARTTQVPLDEDFTVVASGNGKGILEVVTVYHQLPKAYENSTCNGFQLDVSITETKETPPDVEKSYRLNINVRALDRQQVRMVILDVGLPTGFEPENSDLELLTNSVDHYINNFKVVDNLSDRGSLIIHLFRVSSTETDTISFRLHQKFKVGLLQPSTVTVYQYYNKDKRCSRFYSPPEEKKQLDQICKDDVCRCTQGDCCVLKADSLSSSKEERKTMACKERHYAYKVRLVSVSQNHYDQYEVEIIQIIQEGSETGINKKDRIVFLSHGSCRANLNLRKHRNYLVIGPLTDVWRAGSTSNRYVYTLGKSTWVERWPAASECGTDSNLKVKCDELKGFAAELTQSGC